MKQTAAVNVKKGGARMKAQELLTYVEELVFKTSMFGYDKDEVDIQLDKICDEIEAIVKAKDKEIEALKKGQTIIISDESVRLKKDEEESDEQAEEEPQDQMAAQEGQDGLEPQLEGQSATQEDTDSVADDQADFPENDQTEETWEEETQEDEEGFADDEEVEDTNTEEDNELGDAQEDEESWDGETSNEESQDEEEEQAYQPSMGW